MVGEIEAPGYLEGGDFFPAGRDLALVGIGLRSNFEACHQLMERDLLGTRRLAVVKDEFEQHQVHSGPFNFWQSPDQGMQRRLMSSWLRVRAHCNGYLTISMPHALF